MKKPMRIIAVDNIEDMGKAAADIIIGQIESCPKTTLGLATGSTPISLYNELVKAYNRNMVSFKDISTYNLDEYAGLDGADENSYRYFMNTHLFDHIDIDKNRTHVPDGSLSPDAAIGAYRQLLDKAVIDIQVLGIGTNGHIGFNEPGVDFDSRVHLVELDKQTISDNARYFSTEEDVPKQAITMGIADILSARQIILMAGTENKKESVRRVLEGPVGSDCPATALRGHKGLTLIALKSILHDINLNLVKG